MDSDNDADDLYDYEFDEEEMLEDDDDIKGSDQEMPDDEDKDRQRREATKNSYKVLGPDEIRRRQEEDVARLTSVLSVSRVDAILLLLRYKWVSSNVTEAWFEDPERVRAEVGLIERGGAPRSGKAARMSCKICFESFSYGEMKSAGCGHCFCKECWKGYVSTSINDGSGCLTLRCPEPKCRAAVGRDMVDAVAADESRDRYSYYLLRSYVEASSSVRWCPAPDCVYAIDLEVGGGSYDVTCGCAYTFCWNCSNESHRPVSCDIVRKWNLKNRDESENVTWILVHTKACPKCNHPIEKSMGCNHMTCRSPCRYEFCWLCLADWRGHQCNSYDRNKAEGDEKQKSMANKLLDRYAHYYERWATNNKSRTQATADLRKMESVHLKELSHKQCQTETSLEFILKAWEQIIECRRVLKWTYAYGYYLPDEDRQKKAFFEYLQGEAEMGLERLHKCAENDLKVYLKDPVTVTKLIQDPDPKVKNEPNADENVPEDFNRYRYKLTSLTSVTGTYFANLVQALENGLADVNSFDHGVGRS